MLEFLKHSDAGYYLMQTSARLLLEQSRQAPAMLSHEEIVVVTVAFKASIRAIYTPLHTLISILSAIHKLDHTLKKLATAKKTKVLHIILTLIRLGRIQDTIYILDPSPKYLIEVVDNYSIENMIYICLSTVPNTVKLALGARTLIQAT